MLRHRPSSSGGFEQFDFDCSIPEVVYDDIVDRSTFSLESDKENIRTSIVQGAGSGVGSYDDPDNLPSDTEVLIRSGKLDKAEVSDLIRSKTNEIKKLQSDEEKQKASEELQKISDARQAHLDSMIGFNPTTPSE